MSKSTKRRPGYAKEYAARNAHRLRENQLKRKYGITIEEYDGILEAQEHGCAICGGTNVDGRRLHVDHDHITGRVRGLLCFACNSALGQFKDDPVRLSQAITYLTL